MTRLKKRKRSLWPRKRGHPKCKHKPKHKGAHALLTCAMLYALANI
jgi:hypothetical protein